MELHPKQSVTIQTVESKVETSRIRLTGSNCNDSFKINWLYQNFVESNSPLTISPKVQECIELQKKLDVIEQEIRRADSELAQLSSRQERLRNNLQAGGDKTGLKRWQDDLQKSEDAILNLEDSLKPQLLEKRAAQRQQLFESLNQLAIDWKQEPKSPHFRTPAENQTVHKK